MLLHSVLAILVSLLELADRTIYIVGLNMDIRIGMEVCTSDFWFPCSPSSCLNSTSYLDRSLFEILSEVLVLERHIGTSKIRVVESSLHVRRHSVPVKNRVCLAGGISELKLMIQ